MIYYMTLLISLFGAVTWAMATDTAATTSPVPQKLQVTLYLADTDLVLGQSTDVIVRISNESEDQAAYFTYVGLSVFHTRPDGSRVPLERSERQTPPATSPATAPNDPDGWLRAFSVGVEVDCPYDPGHLQWLFFDLGLNGKIAPNDLQPHRSQFVERLLPDWVFVPGECRVRAVLYQGLQPVGSSEARTIRVVRATK